MSFLSCILQEGRSSSSFWLEPEFSDFSFRLLILSRGFIPSPCWRLPSSVVHPDLTYESLIHTLYVLFITITLLIHKQTKMTCPKSNFVLPVQCLLHTLPVTISLGSVTLPSLLDLLKPRTLKSSLALHFLFATLSKHAANVISVPFWSYLPSEYFKKHFYYNGLRSQSASVYYWVESFFSLSLFNTRDRYIISDHANPHLSWEPVSVPTSSMKAGILRQIYKALMIWLPTIPLSSFLVIFSLC